MSLESKIIALAQAIGADIKALRPESSPTLTYTGNQLTRVDYASGNYKVLTYTGAVLTTISYVRGTTTINKAFTYNQDGTLASITET